MTTSNLMSLPIDIAWRRLAFSPDMFDTNFKNPGLPSKWRTSLAAFYYAVPEEETKDIYPDRRIMYLKVTASITGCNFASDGILTNEFKSKYFKKLKEYDPEIDAFQTSTLETVTGELSAYYPCRGAILQVAVFPYQDEEEVNLWDYPYIQDFEPKKRELYETVSRSGEVLSGSSSALNVKKGTTTTESLEESDISSHSVDTEIGTGTLSGLYASGKTKYGYKTEHSTKQHTGKEESHLKTTDASREKREKLSFTTNINQMYQPLLSYHLGTNRALWAISPRPNTVDSEFNLISIAPRYRQTTKEGTLIGRQLEGIQDMFLVVNMPKDSKGLCFQVSLDTGYYMPPPLGEESVMSDTLIVLRRTIQSCGKFDKDDFKMDYFPGRFVSWAFEEHPYVSNEIMKIPPSVLIQLKDINNIEKKTEAIFKANEQASYIVQAMLDGYSSADYEPRPFTETDTFKTVLKLSLEKSTYKISEVTQLRESVEELEAMGIKTVGDLMQSEYKRDSFINHAKKVVLDSTAKVGKKIADYNRERYEKLQ